MDGVFGAADEDNLVGLLTEGPDAAVPHRNVVIDPVLRLEAQADGLEQGDFGRRVVVRREIPEVGVEPHVVFRGENHRLLDRAAVLLTCPEALGVRVVDLVDDIPYEVRPSEYLLDVRAARYRPWRVAEPEDWARVHDDAVVPAMPHGGVRPAEVEAGVPDRTRLEIDM